MVGRTLFGAGGVKNGGNRPNRQEGLPPHQPDGRRAGKRFKYLGVTFDPRRSFMAHLREASAKAEKSVVAVARLMPNIGGHSAAKKRLLASVAESRLIICGAGMVPTGGRV